MATSRYHWVQVTWDKAPEGEIQREGPTNDATEDIRFKCTCKFFATNAVYCPHILVVCDTKGIINVHNEIRKLEPVRKAGAPKKVHNFMSKPTEDGDEGPPLKKYKKLGIIGSQLFLNEFGLGIVEGYNGEKEDTWKVSFPQKGSEVAILVNLCAEEIDAGFYQFKHKQWA